MGGGGTRLKLIFFGTPYYVLPILTAIHKKFVTGPGKSPITAVVTQPPKPVGRKQINTYSPIDKWAHEHKVPVYYSAGELLEHPPGGDIGILASYGEIINKDVIKLFPQGILVIHPSLLPKYRGSSPVPNSIIDGDTVTGCTIFRMDEKMDHGPIITKFNEDVLPTDTGESLRDRLFEKSASVIVETLEPYFRGKIKPRPQNHDEATFTKIIKREDGFVDLAKDDPIIIERKLRAYYPWPGIWTQINLQIDKSTNEKSNTKRLKILKAHIEIDKLVLDEVQLEGKEPVSYRQFKEAYNYTDLNI